MLNKINKVFITLFVGLLLVSSASATNWYLSTASSGEGTGSSRANQRAVSNWDTTFWNNVQPGDTILIDGGVTSKIYPAGQFIRPLKAGTALNKIIITRDPLPGRNGQPIFDGGGTTNALNFYVTSDYIHISNMTFRNGPSTGTIGFSSGTGDVSKGVDIFNCVIEHPYGNGINGYDVADLRIMYNIIKTTPTNSTTDTDGIYLVRGTNVEIAYNYILGENIFDGSATTSHKDNVQLSQMTDLKIHHNFLMQDPAIHAQWTSNIILSKTKGLNYIYNNILVSTAGSHSGGNVNYNIYLNQDTVSTYLPSFYIYDNTQAYAIATTYGLEVVGDMDTVVYKNNLVYKPSGDTGMKIRVKPNVLQIDYNQYYLITTTTNAMQYLGSYKTWTEWQTLGYDTHSKIGAFGLVNVFSRIPTDYKLVNGSSGIDLGTPIAGITDDYAGTLRPQNGKWDVGAYEYVSGAQCAPADTNCDNCITLGEISSYVSKWLQGSVTLPQASSAVSTWMKGC